jgi:hypothetical protein
MDQDNIESIQDRLEQLEGQTLALTMATNALINAVAACDDRVCDDLLKNIGYEMFRLQNDYPDLPDVVEELDLYFKRLVELHNERKSC